MWVQWSVSTCDEQSWLVFDWSCNTRDGLGLLNVEHVPLSAGPPVNACGPDFYRPDRTVSDGLQKVPSAAGLTLA